MVERVKERKREPEPQETIYDQMRGIDNLRIKRLKEGQVVIKGRDTDWEQSRQGLIKFYSYDMIFDKLAVTGWRIFINQIKKHGGKHIHQGGLPLFVLEGKGYTIVDGVRYDWEKGDLILLPIKRDGCEHQHFNEDPDVPAKWIAFIFKPLRDPAGVKFVQVQEHPDWMMTPKR